MVIDRHAFDKQTDRQKCTIRWIESRQTDTETDRKAGKQATFL